MVLKKVRPGYWVVRMVLSGKPSNVRLAALSEAGPGYGEEEQGSGEATRSQE